MKNSKPTSSREFKDIIDWIMAPMGFVVSIFGLLAQLLNLNWDGMLIVFTTIVIGLVVGGYSFSLAKKATEAFSVPQVFITYTGDELETARFLTDSLRKGGYRVFLDKEDIQVGEDIQAVVTNFIKDSNVFLALFSSPPDENIETKIKLATDHSVKIIPVLLGGSIPSSLNNIKYLDMRATEDREAAAQELINVIQRTEPTVQSNL